MRRVSGLNWEDPLTYLPRRPVQDYAKGQVIYDEQCPPTGLYVVILGRVKISTTAEAGDQTVGRIVWTEGLFGEQCLIGPADGRETSIALDDVKLMCWSRGEIEIEIERAPRLGIALAQYFIRQCFEMQDRIESMAIHKTPERVMWALLKLAANLGTSTPDGLTRVPSLTHHTIAEFVGTKREIVTVQMNRLRRMGLVRYSRKFIDIHVAAMCENLAEQGISIPRGGRRARRAST